MKRLQQTLNHWCLLVNWALNQNMKLFVVWRVVSTTTQTQTTYEASNYNKPQEKQKQKLSPTFSLSSAYTQLSHQQTSIKLTCTLCNTTEHYVTLCSCQIWTFLQIKTDAWETRHERDTAQISNTYSPEKQKREFPFLQKKEQKHNWSARSSQTERDQRYEVCSDWRRQTGSSHLYHVQLADDVLSVVARMVQVSLQCLHLPPDHLQILLYLGPLRVGHLIQQSRGAGLVLVVQDAGEDPHVDVQSDVHQLELFSSLWRSGGV